MTPEQLETIRELLDTTGHAPWKHAASDLLDEVDRLREGIEEMADEAEDAWNTTGWWAAAELRALLNPTEGETDDR